MDILCITGTTPGPVTATVAHQGRIRQVALEIARHPSGGWQARRPGLAWGLRCHTVATAVLLEAAETFVEAACAMEAEPDAASPRPVLLAAE